MDWDEMTDEQREAYINQDYVGKDREISYVGGDRELDYLRMNKSALKNHKCVVNDIELGEEELEVLENLNLTDRQIECVVMYYINEMTEEEIAEELGIHHTTVSQHIEYAKKKLWKKLKHLAGDYYIDKEENNDFER